MGPKGLTELTPLELRPYFQKSISLFDCICELNPGPDDVWDGTIVIVEIALWQVTRVWVGKGTENSGYVLIIPDRPFHDP